MSSQTLIYIIIAGIIALFIALFQYKYKSKNRKSTLNTVLVFLRFLTLFSVLLLLINPKIEHLSYVIEKPNLIIAVDNSSSIKHLKQDKNALDIIETITKDKSIQSKFNVSTYTFGNALHTLDSITFTENQTNVNEVFGKLAQVYKNTTTATLLITDGNQTYGNDYQFAYTNYKHPIYPIILGDTITYTDLKIQQFNVNKYAYLKNRFPVEAILVYNGNNKVNTRFVVTKGNTIVYTKPVSFNKTDNSKIINFTLPTHVTGVNGYKANLIAIANEKNTVNNIKNFAVEVIDQKTKIAIVSDFYHPDLGALKKSIESNEQRSVFFFKPKEITSKVNDFQLIILNQPSYRFKKLFEVLDLYKKNKFIIIGPKTDLSFINSISKNYTHENIRQTEDYQAEFNFNYTPFLIDDINFESFPPLKSCYGAVKFNIPFESILTKTIGSLSTEMPLLATTEAHKQREIVLFGEGIWKWRAQSFINTKSFNAFDDFIGKLVQYLASNTHKSRLNIEYDSFYNGSNEVVIKAQFFDKNYFFDSRASLVITVKNNVTNDIKKFPFIVKNNNYEVDLSNLPPSNYSFTIKANNEKISKSGAFTILEYNVEQQFLNANVTKLQQLATNSKGKSYFIDKTEGLVNDLINDIRYQPVQKSNKNIISLIDWKYLLTLIAITLSMEWFLRKYNGLT